MATSPDERRLPAVAPRVSATAAFAAGDARFDGGPALLAAHLVLVFSLDALGLVERLLSPSGTVAVVALPLALLLFARAVRARSS